MKKQLATMTVVIIAMMCLSQAYSHYFSNPWTRDGQVRAHIIQITPRVTGPVTRLHVGDDEYVRKGDLLFEIEPSLYIAALANAKANELQASALLEKARNESARITALETLEKGTVSTLDLNNVHNAVKTAEANLAAAAAVVEQARLNLDFTKVIAPTSGYITNLNLREGAQVVANSPVVALIDANSFWVEGFFKETDLQGVQTGDIAMVTLMMNPDEPMPAVVTSVGYGIAKADGSTGNTLLPNVNANFQWIRLAQRLPVKVSLLDVPADVQLRVGTTASVLIAKSVDPQ
ncbi:efflux RND transporter periplasmic adaptor subunit [Shewanella waksmanii]|uniref:efflux RND transporter periplasmic adaptor subunit n=1 Tax=Shewanella waksmanii TaxID=213783 RepID=UPI00048FEF0E|nr:HlyD family secretion protein [Shewanella waksmanii]